MIRNSVVDVKKTSESSRKKQYLRVDIPFLTVNEREKFEAFTKENGLIKGRFIRTAILRAMEVYEAKNKEPKNEA